MVEVNEVSYPINYDTVANFPDVTEVTEATGQDINRNRDAILTIERVLGKNPHIGLYTENSATATVDERLDILENGIAEGRFAYRNLNVNNILVVTTDQAGMGRVDIGGDVNNLNVAPVYIRGPLRVVDSGLSNNFAEVAVPTRFTTRGNSFQGTAITGDPIVRITDSNANPQFTDRLALQIDGNVLIQNGRLLADFAVNHNQLLGIDTTPTATVAAIHVARGDYHSHKRKVDPVTGALLNEVDPTPAEDTFGLVDHKDLLSVFTKNGQTGFIPVDGVAYHVTNGDDHDHRNGHGAQIDHNYLLNVDPATSNHVTGGDDHVHSPSGDGGVISHHYLNDIGFLTHPEIDHILNVEFAEHLLLIDPANANDINDANAGLAHHVPQGHVSDPNAHHTRYTDDEALSAELLVSADTTVYEEGRNTTIRSHIQAIGSGSVASNNPHGLAPSDIGALEGFDSQGNLPDFTRQFLEDAVEDILQTTNVPLTDQAAEITGIWTFNNTGGVIQIQKAASPAVSIQYDDIARFSDIFDHIDDTGTPPYHASEDISYDPSGSTTPLVATDVKAALDEIDTNVNDKEDQLGPLNQVQTTEIAALAVTTPLLDNAAVTIAKMSNPYSIVPYTFTRQFGQSADDNGDTPTTEVASIWGIEVPALASNAEIVQVTAMWRTAGGSAPTSVSIDLGRDPGTGTVTWLGGGGTGATPPSPIDINALFTDGRAENVSPHFSTALPVSVSAADDLYVYMTRTAGATTDFTDVTVTVYLKTELVA